MRGIFQKTIRWCVLLLAIISGLQLSYAQTAKPAAINFDFENKIPEWLKETNVPAVGIGVIENGKLK